MCRTSRIQRVAEMTEVTLHIYDVTNSQSAKTNNAIVQLNKILRDGIGIGGVFHSAVQIYEEEWSFGYCESGSGLFSCPPKENPMYTYRESLFLGCTSLSDIKVNQLLTELNREWPGYSYDLLSRNCNHFCDQFCEKLGVQKLPAWVNRFANIGETAVEVAQDIVSQLQQAKSDIIAASKFAYEFLFGGAPMSSVSPDPVSIHAVTVPSGSCSSFQISQFKIPVCASSQITANSQDMCRGKSLQETITRDDAELGRDFSAERGFPLADTL